MGFVFYGLRQSKKKKFEKYFFKEVSKFFIETLNNAKYTNKATAKVDLKGLTPTQKIRSYTRQKDIVLVRHLAMVYLSENSSMSLGKIASTFNRTNHSIVIHSKRKINDIIYAEKLMDESTTKDLKERFDSYMNHVLNTKYEFEINYVKQNKTT